MGNEPIAGEPSSGEIREQEVQVLNPDTNSTPVDCTLQSRPFGDGFFCLGVGYGRQGGPLGILVNNEPGPHFVKFQIWGLSP